MSDWFPAFLFLAVISVGVSLAWVHNSGYERGKLDAADMAINDGDSKEWRDALIDARARKEKAKP